MATQVYQLGTDVDNGSFGSPVSWPGGDAMFIFWGALGAAQVSMDGTNWASPKSNTLTTDASNCYLYSLPRQCYIRMKSFANGACGAVALCQRSYSPTLPLTTPGGETLTPTGTAVDLGQGVSTGSGPSVPWYGGDAVLWVTGTKGSGTGLQLQASADNGSNWVNAIPGGEANSFTFPSALPMMREVILARDLLYRITLTSPSSTTVNAYLYPRGPIDFRLINTGLDVSAEGSFLRGMSA